MTEWRSIDPQRVSDIINFNAAERNWDYSRDRDSMFGKQAEGTARLYNLLSEKRIALLADEVGMGKTYQALGVAALAWKQNPEARILIIAPNNSVALNWCYEYDAFIKKNYRRSDNIVRTTLERTPVYTPYFCSSLKEIADVANQDWCHLFVAKTSSFSYILNEEQFGHLERTQAARESALAIRSMIPFTFDLLIVDEAHYFRNRDGGSLRVNSAQGFFNGDGAAPLADRVLLMTATPNHSGVHDIKNIVSYFDGDLADMRSDTILDAVGVRRFRRLAGKNKYQYRKEVSDVADFGGDLEAELFFALYQKRLAMLYRGKGGCRFMYGYLEGFESMTPAVEILTEEAEAPDQKRDPDSTDYHKSIDTDILKTLSAEFKHFSGKPPAHPKYNTFIDIVTRKIASSDVWSPTTDISDLKHLVFTRRIPSVTEITGRINQVYDEAYLRKIESAAGAHLMDLRKIWDVDEFRRRFDEKIKEAVRSREDEADDGVDEEEEGEGGQSDQSPFVTSRVFDLFTIKKKDGNPNVIERTHAGNFRTRFIRKESPYVLFFEPASDYRKGGYPQWKAEDNDDKIDYRLNASKFRASWEQTSMRDTPDTLWAIFYRTLEASTEVSHRSAKEALDTFSPEWREAFARYLQKGVLFASSSLIELYCWFLETLRQDSKAPYETFLVVVDKHLNHSHLMVLLCEATFTFRAYAEKVCAATSIERLKEHRWRFFNNQSPAAAVTGSTKSRERHIQAFNSPFFPNVLIATSVFQEGVNLQFFCRNVHHYGIAWTPGDNEQRVGRIDRLFSLTERRLANESLGEGAFLLSRYPFLSGTLDETQLVSFLKKKLEVEKITDRCGAVQADKGIDIDCSFQDWQKLLRTPVEKSDEQDPYPALVDCPNTFEAQQDPFPDFNPEALLTQIYQTMMEMRECKRAIADFTLYTPAPADSGDHIRSRRTIGMAEVKLRNERHQPFYIELFFSSEFSGIVKGLVYCLRFVTPFDKGHNHKKLGRQLYERWVAPNFHTRYPLAKLAVKSTGDFRNCMIVDLPFFFEKEVVAHLDNVEIALGLEQVLWGADQLEEGTFDGKKDLRISPHGFEEFDNGNCDEKTLSCGQKEKVWDVPSCWEQTERCLVSHFGVGSQGVKGYEKDLFACLTANYDIPALCFYQGSDGCCCRLPLPFVDLQPKELDLFQKWRDLNQRRFR